MSTLQVLMLIVFSFYTIFAVTLSARTLNSEGFSIKFATQFFGCLMGMLMIIFTIIYF